MPWSIKNFRRFAEYPLCLHGCRELPEVFAESEVDRIYLEFFRPWPNHVMQNAVLHQQVLSVMKSPPTAGLVSSNDNTLFCGFSGIIGKEADGRFRLLHTICITTRAKQRNIMTEYEEKFSSKETRSIN